MQYIMSTLKQKQKIIRNTKRWKKKKQFEEIKCVRSTIKYGRDLLYKAKKNFFLTVINML